MNKKKQAEPKESARVRTLPKRLFFFPAHSMGIMATSLEEAVKKVGDNQKEDKKDV